MGSNLRNISVIGVSAVLLLGIIGIGSQYLFDNAEAFVLPKQGDAFSFDIDDFSSSTQIELYNGDTPSPTDDDETQTDETQTDETQTDESLTDESQSDDSSTDDSSSD